MIFDFRLAIKNRKLQIQDGAFRRLHAPYKTSLTSGGWFREDLSLRAFGQFSRSRDTPASASWPATPRTTACEVSDSHPTSFRSEPPTLLQGSEGRCHAGGIRAGCGGRSGAFDVFQFLDHCPCLRGLFCRTGPAEFHSGFGLSQSRLGEVIAGFILLGYLQALDE